MMRRRARNILLALAGLAVAVGVGLAANAVSEDSIGLSVQPLEASESLAPAEARERQPARKPRAPHRRKARSKAAATRTVAADRSPVTTTPDAPPPVVQPVQPARDDDGDKGHSRSRNRGSDDSGGGSDDASGTDSDDSGHGGSDDSGGGSEDSGSGSEDEPDDD